jgi:phosphoribosylformylglycinamidine cyclo-ligase
MPEQDVYNDLGVQAQKGHQDDVFTLTKDMFPHAFNKIYPFPAVHGLCYSLVTDGAGSKPVQTYLHARVTGDYSVFQIIAQDTFQMNAGDAMASNMIPNSFVDCVSINALVLPDTYETKDIILKQLSIGFHNAIEAMRVYAGTDIVFAGGETADLPDQTRTIVVDGTLHAIQHVDNIIDGRVQPGNAIVGIRSDGQAKWEDQPNSGIMCNGITRARHTFMKADYGVQYPEIVSPESKLAFESKSPPQTVYFGKYSVDDKPEELRGMSASEAILSPTRLLGIPMKIAADNYLQEITSIVQNTGGGMTKSMRVGHNIHFDKRSISKESPVFELIQKTYKDQSWEKMYQDFNMGYGAEITCSYKVVDDIIQTIEQQTGIRAELLGTCKRSPSGNRVTLHTKHGTFKHPRKVDQV